MKKLTQSEYKELVHNSKVLQGSISQPKVLLNPQNLIIKHIYKRTRLFSSSKIWPYGKRIQKGANKLKKLSIACPNILQIFYYPKPNNECDIVIYPYMPGDSLDKIIHQNKLLLENLAKFIADLHSKGVFFWDLHLGNILLLKETQKFCLLDIASVKICQIPLSLHKRARNLSRLFEIEKRERDNNGLWDFGIENFLKIYFANTKLPIKKQQKIYSSITKRLKKKDISL